MRARLAFIAVAIPVSGFAQPPSCLDRLSPSDFMRVPVYLVAEPSDSSRSSLATADALLLVVAQRIGAALGDSTDRLPAGDSLHPWRTISRGVTVTVAPDGRFVWGRLRARSEIPSPPAEELVLQALSAAREAGERLPRDTTATTLSIHLALQRPRVRSDGTVAPVEVTRAVPVVTTVVPREEPVRQLREPRVSYPTTARRGGAHGVIHVRFVVDTTGRVDLDTVSDEWPPHVAYPTGELLSYYRDFIAEVTSGLRYARYRAARAGHCKIRAEVIQPFVFRFR